MHIVIHVGGIPFNGNTINERSLGGSESAAYYTAKELASRGHKVVVFTEHKEGGVFDGVTYLWMGERSEQKLMGTNWHFYCENTPHDVNIVQRQPGGFMFYVQSKINLWWAHDIALKRNNGPMMAQGWNVNRILPVSHWFKKQISDNWVINPDVITPVHNGVDYSLFEKFALKDNSIKKSNEITLLYSSRPERGLVNLVGENGIMQKLHEAGQDHIKLLVCGYEHPVPQLSDFYQHLRQRCEDLPNVEHLGQLTKEELAKIQCQEADVWCYPTEFEEVSCITAMECMAAGMYLLTTNTAALPETIGDGYENQVRFNYEPETIVDKFTDWLSAFDNRFRRRPYREYTWARVADEFEEIIGECFRSQSADYDAVYRHLVHNSDIYAADHLEAYLVAGNQLDAIDFEQRKEVDELYSFRFNQADYALHYAEGTEEMYDGPNFHYEGPEFVNHPRFLEVARFIKEKLRDGETVVDYGCAHGHFTNYLAFTFPNVSFVGIDVSPKAIAVARAKAAEMQLKNVRYIHDDWLGNEDAKGFNADLVVLGEILEHVPDPFSFMNTVASKYKKPIDVIITTPFGPWESLSYEKEHPKRFHIHHFERQDIEDLFSHHCEYTLRCLPASHTEIGELLGWYVTTFKLNPEADPARSIDYRRKLSQIVPRQTISFCMIAKNAEADILRLLKSVSPYVDEIIVGVDKTTTDETKTLVEYFEETIQKQHRSAWLKVKVFDIPSPIEIGFDAARNLTIEKATKHWVMWADSDEVLISGEKLPKYLRQNGWNGYGIPQHHFSTEPLGVLSTDFPVRIFRRNDDVRFRGVVHEHPEHKDNRDDGVGFAFVLNELHFAHYGYSTEPVRRKRFMRNISLIARDRKENPDRILGKFLWIRDLALMCRFDLEQTGGQVTNEMILRAKQGLDLWEDTIDNHGDHPQVRRMVKDHLEFYDTLTRVLNEGFVFSIKTATGEVQASAKDAPEYTANFLNKRHLDKFLSLVIDDEVKDYGTKYR